MYLNYIYIESVSVGNKKNVDVNKSATFDHCCIKLKHLHLYFSVCTGRVVLITNRLVY